MDPTSVLKLVREQNRFINGSFYTPSANNTNLSITQANAPQSPMTQRPDCNSRSIDLKYTYQINKHMTNVHSTSQRNEFDNHSPKIYYTNNNNNNNVNNIDYVPTAQQYKPPQTPVRCNMYNSFEKSHNFTTSQSLTAHSSQNLVSKSYNGLAMNYQLYSNQEAMNRSASVKSIASENSSGLDSVSPLSECSDGQFNYVPNKTNPYLHNRQIGKNSYDLIFDKKITKVDNSSYSINIPQKLENISHYQQNSTGSNETMEMSKKQDLNGQQIPEICQNLRSNEYLANNSVHISVKRKFTNFTPPNQIEPKNVYEFQTGANQKQKYSDQKEAVEEHCMRTASNNYVYKTDQRPLGNYRVDVYQKNINNNNNNNKTLGFFNDSPHYNRLQMAYYGNTPGPQTYASPIYPKDYSYNQQHMQPKLPTTLNYTNNNRIDEAKSLTFHHVQPFEQKHPVQTLNSHHIPNKNHAICDCNDCKVLISSRERQGPSNIFPSKPVAVQQNSYCNCSNPKCPYKQPFDHTKNIPVNYKPNNFVHQQNSNPHQMELYQKYCNQKNLHGTNACVNNVYVNHPNPSLSVMNYENGSSSSPVTVQRYSMHPVSFTSLGEHSFKLHEQNGSQMQAFNASHFLKQENLLKKLPQLKQLSSNDLTKVNEYKHPESYSTVQSANSSIIVSDETSKENRTDTDNLVDSKTKEFIIISDSELETSKPSDENADKLCPKTLPKIGFKKLKKFKTNMKPNTATLKQIEKYKKKKRMETKLKRLVSVTDVCMSQQPTPTTNNENENNTRNLNLITQAKQATNRNQFINFNKSELTKLERNRHSADSRETGPTVASSNSRPYSMPNQSLVVAPIFDKQSIVCLAVNSNKIYNEGDIELGEVVKIEKIKNSAFEVIKYDTSTLTPEPSPKLSIPEAPKIISEPPANYQQPSKITEDTPVTLSKKMMPMIMPRINDWLEKCTGFVYKMSRKHKQDLTIMFRLLESAWPRLLILYMIENSFDFCVTKENRQIEQTQEKKANYSKTNDRTNEAQHDLDEKKLVKEKEATELNHIINKGYNFNLNSKQYEDLRELILFKEGSKLNTKFHELYLNAQKSLQNEMNLTHNKNVFCKVLLFLPMIFNVKVEMVENLFCRNLNDSKCVNDLFKKRHAKLMNKNSDIHL